MEARELRQAREKASTGAGIAMRVLDTPEGVQRIETYRAGLNAAKKMGLDVSRLPESYDPKTTPHLLQTLIYSSMEFDKYSDLRQKETASRANGIFVVVNGKKQWVRKARLEALSAEADVSPLAGQQTASQQAGNKEISAARQRIMALKDKLGPGETLRDLIKRRIQKTSNTGRRQADFDPFIEADFRKASKSLVGGDPDFEAFRKALNAAAPKPAPQPQPAAKPEEPGPLDSAGDYLGGLFSGANALPSEPVDLDAMHEGQVFTPVPRRKDQSIDAKKLSPGLIYDMPGPDGKPMPWRWTGQKFELVR